jgi:cyclopropane fatty-acyl-phospholipid synthase-like methyltransferase
VHVTAVDFAERALARAAEVARRLGLERRTQFVRSDLFDFTADEPFDLVVSVGMLHHTGDTPGGVRHSASMVANGGRLYLGLYHQPGRRVFLDALQSLAAREGDEAAFQLYRELDRVHQGDPTLLRSWFRDQVLHPYETQHTLRETVGWFEQAGLSLESTSINRFEPIGDLEALFALELTYAERSRRALEVERRYFPGFFTAMGRRAR